jgi:phosphoglucosamine mutase
MPSKQWAIEVREKKPLDDIPAWQGALAAANGRLDGDGRIFTRYSGTENKLRILVEGKDMEIVEEVGDGLKELIEKEIGA